MGNNSYLYRREWKSKEELSNFVENGSLTKSIHQILSIPSFKSLPSHIAIQIRNSFSLQISLLAFPLFPSIQTHPNTLERNLNKLVSLDCPLIWCNFPILEIMVLSKAIARVTNSTPVMVNFWGCGEGVIISWLHLGPLVSACSLLPLRLPRLLQPPLRTGGLYNNGAKLGSLANLGLFYLWWGFGSRWFWAWRELCPECVALRL